MLKAIEVLYQYNPTFYGRSLADAVGLVRQKRSGAFHISDPFPDIIPPVKAVQAVLGILLDVCALPDSKMYVSL